MFMYTLAITPLIDQLRSRCPDVHQVWYADDATGASTSRDLRAWWDDLSDQGPTFGYHPNASKTYLVVKQEHEAHATRKCYSSTTHPGFDWSSILLLCGERPACPPLVDWA